MEEEREMKRFEEQQRRIKQELEEEERKKKAKELEAQQQRNVEQFEQAQKRKGGKGRRTDQLNSERSQPKLKSTENTENPIVFSPPPAAPVSIKLIIKLLIKY